MLKNIFINCSNHPSDAWDDKQIEAANGYGEIVDIPFPKISVSMSDEELSSLVNRYVEKIMEYKPKAVMCMGEFVTCFKIVEKLKAQGVVVLASVTKRKSVELKLDDGVIRKVSEFKFFGFRKY